MVRRFVLALIGALWLGAPVLARDIIDMRAAACRFPTTSAASMWRMIRRRCFSRRWPPI